MTALVLDMDGVILDSEPVHIQMIDRIMQEIGAAPVDVSQNVGMSSELFWSKVLRDNHLSGPTVPELIARQTAGIIEYMVQVNQPPSEGLYALLDAMEAKGIALAVASSSEGGLVHPILRHLGIWDRFSAIATGDEVENKKPAPDLYLLALERLGVSAENAVAVEDSKTGTAAAKAAGLYTIGYQNPTSGNQDLSCADVIVAPFSEVLGHLNALENKRAAMPQNP